MTNNTRKLFIVAVNGKRFVWDFVPNIVECPDGRIIATVSVNNEESHARYVRRHNRQIAERAREKYENTTTGYHSDYLHSGKYNWQKGYHVPSSVEYVKECITRYNRVFKKEELHSAECFERYYGSIVVWRKRMKCVPIAFQRCNG